MRWTQGMAYGAMHQNQTQSRAPLSRGAHSKGHRPSTLRNEPAPLGRGAHSKGHCPPTLTNEPAPSDKGAHTKGHCPSTLTIEPAPLGRGDHTKGHRHSALTNELAPLGQQAHPKGHCLSTLTTEPGLLGVPTGTPNKPLSFFFLTNELAPLGRGSPSKGHTHSVGGRLPPHSFDFALTKAWNTIRRRSPSKLAQCGTRTPKNLISHLSRTLLWVVLPSRTVSAYTH